jgi:hypothetical protein
MNAVSKIFPATTLSSIIPLALSRSPVLASRLRSFSSITHFLLTVHCRGAIHPRIMCGRYEYTPGEFREIRIRWNLDNEIPLFKPCYNIAPGKDVPVIAREGDRNEMKLMRWGLVPS